MKFPQQNINQSKTGIGGKKLATYFIGDAVWGAALIRG